MRTRKADINRFICKKKKEKSCEIIATAHTMTLSNRKADIVKAKSESVFQIQLKARFYNSLRGLVLAIIVAKENPCP